MLSRQQKDRTEQSVRNKLFICCWVSFVTFSCCVTIVVPFLVCINIDSFGVIICYNLVTGNTPPKNFFPCFLEIAVYVMSTCAAELLFAAFYKVTKNCSKR